MLVVTGKSIWDHYIASYIASKISFLDERELTSSESRYYIGRPGKGLTNSLYLSINIPNKKQKERFSITDITHQDISNLIKKF